MTHPALESVARAICCGEMECYATVYNAKYPQRHQHPCMSHTKKPEATAAIRALLDVPVSDRMADVGAEFTEGDDTAARFAWNDMLAQLVKEIEGEK